MIDGTRKRPFEVRIVGIEPFNNELSVGLALRKDNRLAESITTCYVLTMRQQVRERFINGVLVE